MSGRAIQQELGSSQSLWKEEKESLESRLQRSLGMYEAVRLIWMGRDYHEIRITQVKRDLHENSELV